MAETFYFSHDYGARNDPKLVKLQMELGHEGKGIFWDLIEVCYEQGGYILESELKGISFALHSQYERITDVLTKYDLFKTDGTAYWSESVLKRLEQRTERSDKARQSVLKRWEKYKSNTDVLQTNNEGNTSKVKKSIEEDSKEEDIEFENFWNLYDKKKGDKTKIKTKFLKLTADCRAQIFIHVPKYVASTPEKKYRKDPETYINNKAWNDEIINNEKPVLQMNAIIPKNKFEGRGGIQKYE